MPPAPATAGRLTIGQVEARYRLSTFHPAPAAARLRLDRLVETRLPAALGEVLAGALAADDPTLWLIKGLDSELRCDLAAVDDARLAGALAASVGRSLLRAIAAGPRGDEVLRYRDRPAFVAAFLADLAAGRAWDRWQYQSFASLRSLPPSTAAVEALLREPADVPAVLARLAADGGLDAVLGILSEPAAGRLVAAVVGEGDRGGGVDAPLLAALVERLRADGPGEGLGLAGRRRRQLRLLAGLAAEDPARLADPGLGPALAWAVELAALAAVPGGLDRALAGPLAGAAAELERRGLGELVPALPALRELARRHPDLPGRLEAGPREPAAAGAGAEGGGARELVFESPCAGVFFLLPSYLALGIETLLGDLGDLLPAGERPSMRRLVLARALAGDAAPAAFADTTVFADPALRLACGLRLRPAGAPSGEELPARQGEIAAALTRLAPGWWEERALRSPVLAGAALAAEGDPGGAAGGPPGLEPVLAREAAAVARGLLRHFAARLPGFARASDGHLVRNFLTGTGRVRVTTRPGGGAVEARGAVAPAAIEVELPPMPLAVVARLAGADGLTYELPWLGCPVTLRCAGG